MSSGGDGGVSRSAMSQSLLRRLLLGAVLSGFLVLVVVSAVTAWLVARDRNYTNWVNHTYTVERRLSRFSRDFEAAESARRGYFLTRSAAYLTTYRNAVSELPRLVEQVQALTADNLRQQANVADLDRLLSRKLGVLEASIQSVQTQVAADASVLVEQDQDTVDKIRARVGEMVAEENRLLLIRANLQGENADTLLAVVLGSGVLLAALAGGALVLVRRYAADLARSQAELRRLNEALEQAVRDRPGDLVRANEEIQRFAYIVSHDLRSPLVNVMGFTSELEVSLKPLRSLLAQAEAAAPAAVSRDAREAVETDIPESIGFIRSSTKKMDRLINAILKLSREGRRVLNPELIDMEALLAGIAASVKHLADERGAEVVIEGEVPDLISDRLAVEQVFSNLIENALKYLKPGRPGRVVVRGREVGPVQVFEIEDNGRGVDAKDGERIFELFRRAGAQDQPGEGIGLAHVRALTYRPGGQVAVESALDQGATFRLSLPREFNRDEDVQA